MEQDRGKFEQSEMDPEKLARLLEIELMQKRVAWQRAGAHRSRRRALAFLFLFAVIAAALAAYFFLFANAPTDRPHRSDVPGATPTE